MTFSDPSGFKVTGYLKVEYLADGASNQLRFTNHVNQIVAKAHARGQGLSNSHFFVVETSQCATALVKAYLTYVKPLLRVWNLHYGHPISQRTSAKWNQCSVVLPRLNGLTGYSYSRRFAILRLESLELSPPGLNLYLQSNFWA